MRRELCVVTRVFTFSGAECHLFVSNFSVPLVNTRNALPPVGGHGAALVYATGPQQPCCHTGLAEMRNQMLWDVAFPFTSHGQSPPFFIYMRDLLFGVENIWRILPYLYIRNIISWCYLHYYICRYPRITSRLSVYINPPDPHSSASAVYSHL